MKKIQREGYPFELVETSVESFKPIRDSKGRWRYQDVLQYLVRVIPQHSRDFGFVLSLASYATEKNGLTKRQSEVADKIIKYYEQEGTI
jgi:hypothetical protein